MKRIPLMLCLAAAATLAAQTASKPATQPARSTAATHPAKSTAATHTASATGYKLPPDEKRVPGIPKLVFSNWRYQDIVVGKGPEGESGKLWHVKYKGWRAADGVVFDSWENNRRPEFKDGKPVMGPDNKPVMGQPEPLIFPQGMGRLIPGFDWGLSGMRVGGKRRIFIPWELAYGTRTIPDRPDHPGIPAKSDLIFDVELVDVTDMPAPPTRPVMAPHQVPRPGAPGTAPSQPAKPGTTPPAGAPGTTPAPGSPATEPKQTNPAPNPGSEPQSKPTPPPSTPQK